MVFMIRKGFTLVELLAVIVVLAIILAIAIPGISGIIESSKKGALKADAGMIQRAAILKLSQDDKYNFSIVNELNIKTELNIDNQLLIS